MMSVDVDRQLAAELDTSGVTSRSALRSSSMSMGDAQATVSCCSWEVNGTSWFKPSLRTSMK